MQIDKAYEQYIENHSSSVSNVRFVVRRCTACLLACPCWPIDNVECIGHTPQQKGDAGNISAGKIPAETSDEVLYQY